MSFRERLNTLLAGRPLTAWGRKNHLSGGTISRISGGQVPGQQILNLIQKVENVSLGWLLDGQGAAFLTHHEQTGDGMSDHIARLFAETGWTVTWLEDESGRIAISLTQPGQIDFKGNLVDYTITELVTGAVNSLVVSLLNNWPNKQRRYVPGPTMGEIYTGRVGSYRLQLLLEDAETVTRFALHEVEQVAEENAEYNQEQIMLDSYRQLTPHNQESVRLIVSTLLTQQQG